MKFAYLTDCYRIEKSPQYELVFIAVNKIDKKKILALSFRGRASHSYELSVMRIGHGRKQLRMKIYSREWLISKR